VRDDAAAPPAHPPRLAGLAVALSFACLTAIAWVALTATTGKTYHLAPLVIAAAPALLLRADGRRLARGAAALLAAAGVLTTALAWTVIVASGEEPAATLLPDQPGGVAGEVIVGALAGAIGAYLAVRK
jgi:hypothetical protein